MSKFNVVCVSYKTSFVCVATAIIYWSFDQDRILGQFVEILCRWMQSYGSLGEDEQVLMHEF